MTEVACHAAPWDFPDAQNGPADPAVSPELNCKPGGLPCAAESVFAHAGLVCEERTPLADAALRRAGAIIAKVPGLWPVIDKRVVRIATVRSDDDCFDISHSDPAWPGIVLVSIPPPGPVGDLRLAESIIHEGMHDHLSALEAREALVRENRLLHSPWRNTDRPAGGVLHGLFVFACVAHALQSLIDLGGIDGDALRHAQRRVGEIRGESDTIDHERLWTSLTSRGRTIQAAASRALEQRALSLFVE